MSLKNKIKEILENRFQGNVAFENNDFEEVLLDKENEFFIKQTLFDQVRDFDSYPEEDKYDFDKYTHDFYLKVKNLKEEKDKSKQFSLEFKQRQNLQKIIRIAAIFVLFFGFSFMFYNFIYKANNVKDLDSDINQFVVSAPLGAKTNVSLPDGSSVCLNAGSTLTYSTNFNSVDRKLILDGEAFFDVAKNEDILFEVVTSEISIAALGTQFNVKAYNDEKIIETTLVEGKVRITKNDQTNKNDGIFLTPNQTATYVKEISEIISNKKAKEFVTPKEVELKKGKVIIQEDINSEVYTSWKEERWIIEAEELSSLAKKIERKFNVDIEFSDMKLAAYKFTGSLEDETLEQVLAAIKLTAPIEFSIENNLVTITENELYRKEFNRILK